MKQTNNFYKLSIIEFLEMTLVYREEKKEVFQPNTNQLGPGYYSFPSPPGLISSIVPFNSSIQRNLFNESQFPVGPGFYEIKDRLISKQNLSGHIFKSQVERFRRSNEDLLKQQPKPSLRLKVGQNDCEQDSSTQKMKSEMRKLYMTTKVSKIEERLRKVKTIPSIPTIKQSFGYQMNESDELILNKNPRQVMSRLDEIRNKKKIVEPKGLKWSKSKQSRKPFQVSNNGFYFQNAKASWDTNAFRYHESKFMSSQTRKLALLKLRYGQKFQDYFDEDSQNQWIQKRVFENNPGPGHYLEKEENRKCLQKQKYDCFGSCAERFPFYNIKQKTSKQQQHKKISQSSTCRLDSESPKNQRLTNLPIAERFQMIGNFRTPGPGHYKDQILFKESSKFGNEDKFYTKKMDEIPGPGSYCEKISKISNFQKFNLLNDLTKEPILTDQKEDKLSKLAFMISSNGNFDQPIHHHQKTKYKPQYTNTFQQSLVTMKKTLQQIVSTQQKTQEESETKQSKQQGKLQKPKFALKKKKQFKQTLGPGCYYKQLPYGKSTFNVTYT